jgi:hypothetical protein
MHGLYDCMEGAVFRQEIVAKLVMHAVSPNLKEGVRKAHSGVVGTINVHHPVKHMPLH